MYAVKLNHNKQLKSWHKEDNAGLRAAIEEADARTHATNMLHIVTANDGTELYASDQLRVVQPVPEPVGNDGAFYMAPVAGMVGWAEVLSVVALVILWAALRR